MKKTLLTISLGACTILSANQYYGGYNPSCPGGNCPYNQGQQPQPYYQGQQSQPYYQGQQSVQQPYYNQGNQSEAYYQGSAPANAPGQYYQNPNAAGQNYRNVPQYRDNSMERNQPNQNYNTQYRDTSMDGNPSNDYQDVKRNKEFVSDQDISKNVRETIGSGWFSKGYEGVSFEVYNGTVTLKGNVETQEEKNKVDDAVRRIDGVKQVNNQISVKGKTAYNSRSLADNASKVKEYETKFPSDKANTESDRILNAKIRDKLNGGWFSSGYDTIVLRTSNGVVVVSGVVDSMDDIQKINKDIQKIEGVKSVNNQLSAKKK